MIRRLRRVALVCAACACAMVILELGLRSFWSVARGYYVLPPGLDTLSHADSAIMPGVDGTARLRVNSVGLRGGEIPAGAKRVLLAIGGSTTECLFLDEAESWPGLLERAGERRFGAGEVWVGNAGRSGRTSREHIVQLERILAAAPRIDRVVVLVGVNDLGRRLARGGDHPADWRADPALVATVERSAFDLLPIDLETEFPQRLALYRVAKLAKLRWQAGKTRADAFDPRLYGAWRRFRQGATGWRAELPDLGTALAEYRDNIRAMIAIARAHHVRVLFLTQPAIWRADLSPELEGLLWMGGVGNFQDRLGSEFHTTATLAEGMRRYNDALMETCAAEGAECFDLAARIPKDGSAFYDDVHFSEEGARQVALAIEDLVWR